MTPTRAFDYQKEKLHKSHMEQIPKFFEQERDSTPQPQRTSAYQPPYTLKTTPRTGTGTGKAGKLITSRNTVTSAQTSMKGILKPAEQPAKRTKQAKVNESRTVAQRDTSRTGRVI